ncbi:hypothetical protein CLOACE_16810 [Clostridium acetireducens DSM 10703]|jgi:hypothetical protein|uniref:Uncharacterized protein n=1 Tax=Clostridium acetireducens DSM 10703 TaxID=1121290 RepID=A0A1E8EY58_9CLOT|nr:hypothetical protein [Clostridium acetireducens]OFI05452.1 hypothetical protein CLOACE_16810 [Clostridium acetireducens DSM 10703]
MENSKIYITKEVIEECLIECLEEKKVDKKESENINNLNKEK